MEKKNQITLHDPTHLLPLSPTTRRPVGFEPAAYWLSLSSLSLSLSPFIGLPFFSTCYLTLNGAGKHVQPVGRSTQFQVRRLHPESYLLIHILRFTSIPHPFAALWLYASCPLLDGRHVLDCTAQHTLPSSLFAFRPHEFGQPARPWFAHARITGAQLWEVMQMTFLCSLPWVFMPPTFEEMASCSLLSFVVLE